MSIVKIYGTGRTGFLIASDDAGETWSDLTAPAFRSSSTPTVAVNPYNGDKLIMAGIKNDDSDPVIYYSYDSGTTFNESTCTFLPNSFAEIPTVQIIDKYVAYIACESGVYKSTDQYVTFTAIADFTDTSTYDWVDAGSIRNAKLHFESVDTGVIAIYDEVNSKAFVWTTTDGGATWTNACIVPIVNLGDIWSNLGNQRLLFSNTSGVKVSVTGCFGPIGNFPYVNNVTAGIGPRLAFAGNNTLYTPGGANITTYTPIYKTTDGGLTWAIVSGNTQSSIDFVALAFYNPTSGITSNGVSMYKTTNGGASWTVVYNDKTVTELAAVEYNCDCPVGFMKNAKNECYNTATKLTIDRLPCPVKLTSCSNPAAEPLYTLSEDISSQVNSVVKTTDGDCFLITPNTDLSINTITPEVEQFYLGENGCQECNPIYNIFVCGDYSTPLYCTFEDLSEYVNKAALISVNDNEIDGCYRIGIALDNVCEDPVVISIRQSYDTCEECQPVFYVLTSCSNSDVFIVTENPEFNAVVGDVVTVKEHTGLCWTVTKQAVPYEDIVTVTLDQTYTDCNCCFDYQCKI